MDSADIDHWVGSIKPITKYNERSKLAEVIVATVTDAYVGVQLPQTVVFSY